MTKSRLLLFSLLLLLPIYTAVGQPTALTKEQVSTAYFQALEKAQERARRHSVKTSNLKGKMLAVEEEWLMVYDGAFKSHLIHTEYSPKFSKKEMITSDEKVFCKVDDGSWERSDRPCLLGPVFAQVLGLVSSRFSVESTKLGDVAAKLYRESLTYGKVINPDGKVRFSETKFWLNQAGLLLRRETKLGVVGTEEITYHEVHTIEYDPTGLRIDVPTE